MNTWPKYFQVIAEIRVWKNKPKRILLESNPLPINKIDEYTGNKQLQVEALFLACPWYSHLVDNLEYIKITIDILVPDIENGGFFDNRTGKKLIEYHQRNGDVLYDTVK
jgi:hypothetical protein